MAGNVQFLDLTPSSYDFHFVNQVVLPGDIVAKKVKNTQDKDVKVKLKLGPGLRIDKENIVAYKCGVLREKNNAMFWIDTDQKRVFAFFPSSFYVYCNELVFELTVIDDVVACLSVRMCKGDQSRKLTYYTPDIYIHRSTQLFLVHASFVLFLNAC